MRPAIVTYAPISANPPNADIFSRLPASSPDGTVIYVDPRLPHQNGSFVVAKTNGSVTFKRLEMDGDAAFLVPLNTQYQATPVTDDIEIVGSVIGSYTDL